MEEFTYEQIRAKALKQGIKDNRVHIGLWANLNNYLKTRRKNAGIIITSLWQRINILQPVLLATLLGMCAFVGIIIWGFGQMDKDTMNKAYKFPKGRAV